MDFVTNLVTFFLDLVTFPLDLGTYLVTFFSPNHNDKFLCLVIIHKRGIGFSGLILYINYQLATM